MKLPLFLRAMTVMLVTSCLVGCTGSTGVNVINYDDAQYYEVEKNGKKYQCMSEYYVDKVLQSKIKKINP